MIAFFVISLRLAVHSTSDNQAITISKSVCRTTMRIGFKPQLSLPVAAHLHSSCGQPSPEFQVCLVISPNPIDRDLCNSGFANERCTLAELTTPPRVFPQAHQTMPHGLWLHHWLGNCPAMWRNALEYARSKRGFSPGAFSSAMSSTWTHNVGHTGPGYAFNL